MLLRGCHMTPAYLCIDIENNGSIEIYVCIILFIELS